MDDFTTQYMKALKLRTQQTLDWKIPHIEMIPIKINYEPVKVEFLTNSGKITFDWFRVTFTDGDKDVN